MSIGRYGAIQIFRMPYCGVDRAPPHQGLSSSHHRIKFKKNIFNGACFSSFACVGRNLKILPQIRRSGVSPIAGAQPTRGRPELHLASQR